MFNCLPATCYEQIMVEMNYKLQSSSICLHAFGFIMYLVLALLKVAPVNFALNEYMMMTTSKSKNKNV